jgi:catechol-2,3-dioxygenase
MFSVTLIAAPLYQIALVAARFQSNVDPHFATEACCHDWPKMTRWRRNPGISDRVETLMAMTEDTTTPANTDKPRPALKLKFLSHGTLESRDLAFSRKFYEEFLGLDVVQTSPISLLVRLGGNHTYAVVYSKQPHEMNLLNHNGLDVSTKEEVDVAHRVVVESAQKWKLSKISKPHLQHGTYSFYFWDADGNSWEILTNPEGGYSWLFEKGDLEGKGHLDRNFKRPGVDI